MRTDDSCDVQNANYQTHHERSHSRFAAGPEEVAMLTKLHPQELLDRYMQIKDDYFSLKKSTLQQANELKRTTTRVRKLEKDLKKEERPRRPQSGPPSIRLDEQKQLTDVQATAMDQLAFRNQALERKLKMASIQMFAARNNKPVMYRDVGPRVDTWLRGPPRHRLHRTPPATRPSTPASPLNRRSRTRSLSPKSFSSELDEPSVPQSLQKMLSEAAYRIKNLEGTRVSLENMLQRTRQSQKNDEMSHHRELSVLESSVVELRERLRKSGTRVEEEATDAVLASRETFALRTKLDAYEERTKIAQEMLQVERQRRKEFITETDDLRSQLQTMGELLRTCQLAMKKVVNDHEELIIKHEVLRRERANLEQENQRLAVLNDRCLQETRVPLQGQVAGPPLRARIAELEKALQDEHREKEQLLAKLTAAVRQEELSSEQLTARATMNDQLRLQLADAKKAAATLQLAASARVQNCTIRSMADRATQSVDPVEPVQSAPQADANVLSNDGSSQRREGKEKYTLLQARYEQKSQDLHEANSLLADHASAIADLTEKGESTKEDYVARESQLLRKIQVLEVAVKDREEKLLNSTPLESSDNVEPNFSGEQLEGNSKSDYLSQSLKLSKRDCVMEFHIEKTIFDSSAYDHQKTFVAWTMPFSVEDPLQHTDLAIGSLASYRHTSLYRLHTKALKLLQDPVIVSVYVLLPNGYPGRVGEAHIPLTELMSLESGGSIERTCVLAPVQYSSHEDEQSIVPEQLLHCEQQVLATMTYRLRLQRPVSDREPTSPVAADQHEPQQSPVAAPRTQLQSPDTNGDQGRVVEYNRVDHKRKTSLRRKMQHLKHRNDSIHETEDEEDEQSYSGSESEDIYERNANLLMSQVRNTKMQMEEDSDKKHSGRPTSSKKKKVRSHDADDLGNRHYTKKVRPTSSKSYQARRKKSSSRPLHRSLEHLPKQSDGMNETVSQISDDPENVTPRNRQYTNRPRSAPRKDREVYHSTTPSTSSEQDSFFEESSNGKHEDNRDEISGGNSSDQSEISYGEQNEENQDSSNSSLTEERFSTDSEGVVGTAMVPRKNSRGKSSSDTITIEITKLKVVAKQLLTNQPRDKLFISFQEFLPIDPKHLSTPNSLMKPKLWESINFHFKQDYDVSKNRHPERREALQSLFRKTDCFLKLYLNSEPPEDIDKDCSTLGIGSVDLRQVVQDNLDGRYLDVNICNSSDNLLAQLKVALTISPALANIVQL